MSEDENIDVTLAFEKMVLGFFKDNFNDVIDRTDGTKNKGMPDIEIAGQLYIECTVAKKGEGDDGATWETPIWEKEGDAAFQCIPDETVQAWRRFAFQRITNRLVEKQGKFENSKDKKYIDTKLPRIVALTLDLSELSENYDFDYIYEDVLRKLLWDNGDGLTLQTYLDGTSVELPLKDGITITSQNGAKIDSGIFNDVEFNYKNISAVLFVSPFAVKQAMQGKQIGIKDMYLCVNRFAEVQFTEEYWCKLMKIKILRE